MSRLRLSSAEAKAWATGFAEARTFGRSVSPAEHLTVRQLWERYTEAEFPHLRPKTQTNYTGHWKKWELFLGRHFIAEDVKLGDITVGRGSLYWHGSRRRSPKRISWSQFAEMMDQLAYG